MIIHQITVVFLFELCLVVVGVPSPKEINPDYGSMWRLWGAAF